MNVMFKVYFGYARKSRGQGLLLAGIILSAAMMTALFLLFAGISRAERLDALYQGNFHVWKNHVTANEAMGILSDERTAGAGVMTPVGYCALEQGSIYKNYLYLASADEAFMDRVIRLREGRLPENESEVILPAHLLSETEGSFCTGMTLELTPGRRRAGNVIFWQESGLHRDMNGMITEELEITGKKRIVTVTGIYEHSCYCLELLYDPGYVVLCGEGNKSDTGKPEFSAEPEAGYTLAVSLKKPKADLKGFIADYNIEENMKNASLLTVEGVLADNLISRGVTRGVLIAVTSVSAFLMLVTSFLAQISRKKQQLGLLASVGATPAQIRQYCLAEALTLSLIGIPAGFIPGTAGAAVIMDVFGEQLRNAFLSYEDAVTVRPVFKPESFAAAAGISLAVILISAWIPAWKLSACTPIEAIRGSREIRIRKRNAGRIRALSPEGRIAAAYRKRAKNGYAATVFGLGASVFMILAAGVFLQDNRLSRTNPVYHDFRYDLQANITAAASELDVVLSELREEPSVMEASGSLMGIPRDWPEEEERLSAQLKAFRSEEGGSWVRLEHFMQDGSWMIVPYWLDDLSYAEFAQKTGYQGEGGILINHVLFYGILGKEKYSAVLPVFDSSGLPWDICPLIPLGDGKTEQRKMNIGALADETPLGVRTDANRLSVVFPESTMPEEEKGTSTGVIMVIVRDHDEAMAALTRILKEHGETFSAENISDNTEEASLLRKSTRFANMMTAGICFLLISFALLGMIRSVSANLDDRRRDYAILQSIGLSDKGLTRMLLLEQSGLAARAWITGFIPGAALTAWLNWKNRNMLVYDPILPWKEVLLGAAAVWIICLGVSAIFILRRPGKDLQQELRTE